MTRSSRPRWLVFWQRYDSQPDELTLLCHDARNRISLWLREPAYLAIYYGLMRHIEPDAWAEYLATPVPERETWTNYAVVARDGRHYRLYTTVDPADAHHVALSIRMTRDSAGWLYAAMRNAMADPDAIHIMEKDATS